MTPISSYVLTHNSEKYLEKVLTAIAPISEEIIIVDSGSKDQTEEIGKRFGVKFIFRTFDNFTNQRNFAASQCQHNFILFVDSDEIIDEPMINEIELWKKADFFSNGKSLDAILVKRRWYLFEKEVHNFLPVKTPDYPVRLFDKRKVSFTNGSRRVHESPFGHKNYITINKGAVHHYSCDSIHLLFHKLNQYTTLAAEDMKDMGKSSNFLSCYIHGLSTWSKWYIQKGGYKDGKVGFLLGVYAFSYGFLKYLKLMFIK